MTVQELIDELQKHDPALDVEILRFPGNPELPESIELEVQRIVTTSNLRQKITIELVEP